MLISYFPGVDPFLFLFLFVLVYVCFISRPLFGSYFTLMILIYVCLIGASNFFRGSAICTTLGFASRGSDA